MGGIALLETIPTFLSTVNTLTSLTELAAKQFGREADAIDADAPVGQLGIDSLGFLEFMFELEDHFGVSIPQDEAAAVQTLRELAALIDTLIAAKPALPG